MSTHPGAVAVVGAGLAGASCALGLRHADVRVTVFERAWRAGGRMASREATWTDDAGIAHCAMFDHGAQGFVATRPRFRGVMARAVVAGCAVRWEPIVHSLRPAVGGPRFVPTPTTPALAAHLLSGADLQVESNVQRLQRTADGTWFVASDRAALAGPFSHVVLAVPPAQAAVLLAGHRDDWAAELAARRMDSCWTLMAVTDDLDWPWDAAEPKSGPLAWVARNDRVPGRRGLPGLAVWTAHSTAEWSAGRLDTAPEAVCRELQAALGSQLPTLGIGSKPWRWHHAAAHRWRHAGPPPGSDDGVDACAAWWDPSLGLGVCGDWLGGGGVEAAWFSGDELADEMAQSFEHTGSAVSLPPHPSSVSSADDQLVPG